MPSRSCRDTRRRLSRSHQDGDQGRWQEAAPAGFPLEEIPDILQALRKESTTLSDAMEFEKAAAVRDRTRTWKSCSWPWQLKLIGDRSPTL